MRLHRAQMGAYAAGGGDDDYIVFQSESVGEKCAELYGSGGRLTYAQAQAVTTIENVFGTTISGPFDELRFFTNATTTTASALRANKLTSISFPASITSLGWGTCYQCSQLAVVTIYATTPPAYGANSFTSCAPDLKIYVPDESVAVYKEATGWVALADIIYGFSEKE